MLGILQTRGSLPGQLANILGIGLIMIYLYYHIEYRRASQEAVERNSRQRATIALFGFMFYAIVVASFGPQNSWVASIGITVESYFQALAQNSLVSDLSGTSGSGLLNQSAAILKTIGLIAYVILFSIVSISEGMIKKVLETLSWN